MIDKFGQVMLYVDDVQASADFWTNKVEFTVVDKMIVEDNLVSVELSPYNNSDTNLVLFSKEFVRREHAEMGIEMSLNVPSLLFSTYDIKETHKKLKENGVLVSDISDMGGLININFPDNENNYFAIREIK